FNSLGFYKFHKTRAKKIQNLLGTGFKSAPHKQATTNYLQTLDHIFVKNLAIADIKVLKYKGSDHFPLMAEIKV
ncbi:MAG: hypothetical protein ACHQVK_05235, partial [Candidatus Paceibacterales bacterium]